MAYLAGNTPPDGGVRVGRQHSATGAAVG